MGRMLGKRQGQLTYLGPETEVLGDLKAKGQVRIDGRVQGSVLVEGDLEVGPTGVLEGPKVVAQNLVLHGEIRAEVEAGRVSLARTAKLWGVVRSQTLEVEAGAVFVGQSLTGETRALEAPKEA